MGQKDTNFEKLRAHLRRLGNPYATLELAEYSDRPSGNPYAVGDAEFGTYEAQRGAEPGISFSDPLAPLVSAIGSKGSAVARPIASAQLSQVVGRLAKGEFEIQARVIFEGYKPKFQRHLNRQHREFIARHAACSPEHRYAILAELKRYDLRSTPGVTPYFNREDGLTADKLLEIEQRVEKDQKKS